jgi:membrane protease subunit (stomatin/prohibitin family)
MALTDVIEWRDTGGDVLVQRWPESGAGSIRLGAQLTVRESQVAVFYRDGKALDVLEAGRHTLETANLPLLQTLVNLPFGGRSPFQAEVYFVSMKTFTGMKWGTPTPIVFRDTELHTVSLRAFGSYTMRVREPQLFVNTVVGTEDRADQEAVEAWLRGFVASRFTDTLGNVMQTVLDLPRVYEALGVAAKARVGEDFARYGLELVDFVVEAVTPPDDVMEMINERARMEAVGDMGRFTQFRAAEALGDAAKADGGGMASAGVGMGAGVAMGATLAQAVRDATAGPTEGSAGGEVVSPAGSRFCASCGSELVPGARFCSGCGAKVAGQ